MKGNQTSNLISDTMRTVLANTQDFMFVKDKNLIYVGASQTFAVDCACRTGIEDVIGKTDYEVFEDPYYAAKYRKDDEELLLSGTAKIEYREAYPEKDGKNRYCLTTKYLILNEAGEPVGIFGQSRDITEQVRLEQEIGEATRIAGTDALTGLLNRGGSEQRLISVIQKRIPGLFCLFDINSFKHINDRYGHAAGDYVLKQIAQCMKGTFGEQDILARFGGDEFVIFSPDITTLKKAQICLDQLVSYLEKKEREEIGNERIRISIGAYLYDGTASVEFGEIYEKCDTAMYHCKRQNDMPYQIVGAEGMSPVCGKRSYRYEINDSTQDKQTSDWEIITELSRMYLCSYYLDLTNNSYTVIKRSSIEEQMNRCGSTTQQIIEEFIRLCVDPKDQRKMADFMNLKTLEQRMETEQYIECEYQGLAKNDWYRARFIAVRHNVHGALTHVLFLVAGLDSNIASQLSEYAYSKKSLETLFDHVPGGVVMYEWNGEQLKILHISRYYQEQYGESLIREKNSYKAGIGFSRIHPDDVEGFKKAMLKAVNETNKITYVYRVWNKKRNRYEWTQLKAVLEPQPEGTTLVYALYFDITAQKEAEIRLEKSRASLNAALSASNQLSYEYDPQLHTGVCYTDENFFDLPKHISNYPDSLREINLFHPDDAEKFIRTAHKMDTGAKRAQCDVRILKNGEYRWYSCMFDNYFDSEKERNIAILTVVDISDRMTSIQNYYHLLEKLRFDSEHDPLTGLFNRKKFMAECEHMLKAYPNEQFAMLHFDLKNFHRYNSFFGDQAGDQLLCNLADVLRTGNEGYDHWVYGRMESDVFCSMVPFSRDLYEKQTQAAITYLKEYRDDYLLEPKFGLYFIKDHEMPIEAMITRAAIAANKIQPSISNALMVYTDKMEDELHTEQSIINEMQSALDQGQFQIYLQPKYALSTCQPAGAEALVRWIHPVKGIVSPGAFIPVFEKNGFITNLDRYMWEQACILIRKWMNEGKTVIPISVNVSRVSIFGPNTVTFLKELTRKYQIEPKYLELELTESAYIDNPDEIKTRLLELQKYGFKILLDDFGSGYSSLNTLREQPVDVLKLDMKFLSPDQSDIRGGLVISSIIRMAKLLKLVVIAEGVETQEQADYLTSVGCEYVQGYLFARPMPVSDFENVIAHSDTTMPHVNIRLTEDFQQISETESEVTALRRSIQEEKEINKKKDTLIAQISHEIRTPLNVIISMAGIAKEELDNIDMVRDNLTEIANSSRILLGIVNNILDISALASGTVKIEEHKFDLRDEITNLGIYFYEHARYKDVHFDMHIRGVSEENLIGDERRLQQIMTNLFSNSLRFTPEGGKIDLSVTQASISRNRVHMRFILQDTGSGLSEEMIHDLFLPYDEKSAVTKNNYTDTGISLFVTKQLIEVLGGSVSVESNEREGTKFIVDIPFTKTEQRSMNMAAVNRHRVLLVADYEVAKERGAMLLDMGIPYAMAFSKDDALELLGQADEAGDQFSVCMIDMNMKGTYADTLIVEIRKIFGKEPIIIATSYLTEEDIYRHLGADYAIENALFRSTVFDALMKIEKGNLVMESNKEKKNYLKLFDFSGKRIMVVEDVSLNMEVVVKLLNRVNATVICAENGKEAVQTFHRKPAGFFDCILMDINMPVMNGYQAAEEIRKSEKEDAETIPIFAMTANAFSEDIAKALEAGMTGHIAKPIDVQILYRTLNKVFNGFENPEMEHELLEKAQILERQNTELKIRAEHDPLTGLYNRYAYEKETYSLMRKKEPIGFILLDIDHFKEINDVYGHETGDAAIKYVAKVIKANVRPSDIVVRLGGDEFAIILRTYNTSRKQMYDKFDRISRELAHPMADIPAITLSAGVAFSDMGYTNELYGNADKALYQTKQNGRNGCTIYEEELWED